jgi:hypothetical protein
MVQSEARIMTELDARCETDGTISFANGSDDQAKLMEVMHKLDDEISQLIRDTPVTPIPAFDHGISRSTADAKVALITIATAWNALADRADAQPPRDAQPEHATKNFDA